MSIATLLVATSTRPASQLGRKIALTPIDTAHRHEAPAGSAQPAPVVTAAARAERSPGGGGAAMDRLGETVRSALARAVVADERWRTGVSYNPLSAGMVQDSYSVYAALRARATVHRCRLMGPMAGRGLRRRGEAAFR